MAIMNKGEVAYNVILNAVLVSLPVENVQLVILNYTEKMISLNVHVKMGIMNKEGHV